MISKSLPYYTQFSLPWAQLGLIFWGSGIRESYTRSHNSTRPPAGQPARLSRALLGKLLENKDLDSTSVVSASTVHNGLAMHMCTAINQAFPSWQLSSRH